jgi:hypothetical protein
MVTIWPKFISFYERFMNASEINGIEKKTGVTDIVGLLAERLSGSELSTLMLGKDVGMMKSGLM